MGIQLTNDQFIERARSVHGDKYSYENVNYINLATKVSITCREHGDFLQTPNSHISKKAGCPECRKELMSKKFRSTPDEILTKFREVHGDRYIYHLEGNPASFTKIKIECREHGIFRQTVASHISGSGCPDCALKERGFERRLKIEDFLERAKTVHGDKYDYSNVILNKNGVRYDKVEIICKDHGKFYQDPFSHLSGKGCAKCAKVTSQASLQKAQDRFVERATKIHEGKYDYSKVVYKNCKEKVIIVCPKHGEFLQTPDGHIQGKGCAKCSGGYSGASRNEYKLLDLLKPYGYEILHSDRKIIRPKELDFVFPELNLAIEYNGHFFHGVEKKNYKYHELKYNLAKEKGYKVLSIWDFDFLNKKEIVERYLDLVLKGDDGQRVFENLNVKILSQDRSYKFYKENSLFSVGNPLGFHYGLFSGSNLIAVCSLSRSFHDPSECHLNYYAGLNYSKVLFMKLLEGVKGVEKSLNFLTFDIHKDNRQLHFLEDLVDKVEVSSSNFDLYYYHYRYGVSNQYDWSGDRLDQKLEDFGIKSYSVDENIIDHLSKKQNLRCIFDAGYETYKIIV